MDGPPPGTAERARWIATPDQRLRVFISSTMVELAQERQAVRDAVTRLRLIPVEGVRVADLSAEARARVLDVVAAFVRLLPAGPRAARLREIEAHLDETWFSWIGGHEPGDVFYYRLQSPVVIAELDHHCGVFLDYDTPQPFHVHTVLRTPHGNDYGRAWVRQWQEDQA